MGWPKKNEEYRLYFERAKKSYLIVDPKDNFGVAEVMTYNDPEKPMLCTTSREYRYLYVHCRRVSWLQMPEVWQDALKQWLDDEPDQYRGLWRVGELEEYTTLKNTPDNDLPLLIGHKWRNEIIKNLYERRLKYGKMEHKNNRTLY